MGFHQDEGGSAPLGGMGIFLAPYFYDNFIDMKKWLLPTLR